MKLALIPAGNPGNHQYLTAEAVAAGMKRHGDTAIWVSPRHRAPLPKPHEVDGVLVWSWRTGKRYRDAGYNVLLMERAYFADRFVWTSLGWNGLNNRARFAQVDDGGARFRRHFANAMRPWRPAGQAAGYALILGQVPSDAAVRTAAIGNYVDWLKSAAAELSKRKWRIVFRPHPRFPHVQIPGVQTSLAPDIENDLAGAGLAVTLNSNAGVLAVMFGTATVALDAGAMTWDVTAHDFDTIVQPDREAWGARVAYSQWLLEEIADGSGWEHVRAAHPGITNGGSR